LRRVIRKYVNGLDRSFRSAVYRISEDIRGGVKIFGGVEATRGVDARDGDVLVPQAKPIKREMANLVDLTRPPFFSPIHTLHFTFAMAPNSVQCMNESYSHLP